MRSGIASSFIAAMLLAGCGLASKVPALTPTPQTGQPTATPGAGQGTWSGTVTRDYEEHSITNDATGTHDYKTIFKATVQIGSVRTDPVAGAWKLTGQATIHWERHFVDSGCMHFTDDGTTDQTVPIEDGGLSADDTAFEFWVSLPYMEAPVHTVRDNSGCGGPRYEEDVTIPMGSVRFGGSGQMTDPNTISGISNDGQGETVTWHLTLNP